MNNCQMDRGNENPTQHLPWWFGENHEKTPVRLDGTEIRTRDIPYASLVRYHGATSLGNLINWLMYKSVSWFNKGSFAQTSLNVCTVRDLTAIEFNVISEKQIEVKYIKCN